MTRVLITGARAPAALQLARLFAQAGHEVLLADTLRFPLARFSPCTGRYFRLPPPATRPADFAAAVRDLVAATRPALVIPTCEEVFYLAWAFEREGLACPLFAPALAVLAAAHDKARFAADARRFGLAPPETTRIDSPAQLSALAPRARCLVFKPVWSRFASAVQIGPGQRELARILPTPAAPWVAQTLIPGEEICAYAVAREGRVLALACYRPRHRAGRGAGVYFEPVCDEQVAADASAYVAATAWTGQISFDFRRDEAGRIRVLECNPRATSGVHFYGPNSGLAEAILQGARAQPNPSGPLMIPAAMATFALQAALQTGRAREWLRDYAGAADALAWPGERLPFGAQTAAMLELAGLAARERSTLIEASTSGIAWDGQDIGG